MNLVLFILDNEQLAIFEELNLSGYRPLIQEGDQAGRGFADLGYEQFLVLPSNKLLSLFTGTITPVSQSDLSGAEGSKLFQIPSVDQLMQELATRGVSSLNCSQAKDGSWICQGSLQGLLIQEQTESLYLAAAQLLLGVFKRS